MKRPKLPLVYGLAALAVAVVVVALSPVLVAGSVRGWLWWAARQEGLQVQLAGIEAPLLRPVVLHGLQVRTAANAKTTLNLSVTRAEFALNLATIFGQARGRHIRDLNVDRVSLEIGKNPAKSTDETAPDWRPLRRLFADSFRITRLDVRVQTDATRVEARDISISASEVESGKLHIGEIAVAGPLFSQHFKELRGATSWQNQRLTLGAIAVSRGIDVDAFTIDFSHVALRRIGLEMNLDLFGGKMRANLSAEARSNGNILDVAGTASDISLAQMSQTLGWRNAAAGAVRACKFTYRGRTSDWKASTVSIWSEVSGLRCAGKAAETIMLGASLYNRRLHLEQLYVKQSGNQLTLSGDMPFTLRAADWAKPDLNADVSGNIGNLDELAQLFGAEAGEYTGALVFDGSIAVEDRKLRGGIVASGAIQMVNARGPGHSRTTADLTCAGGNAYLAYANVTGEAARLSVWGELDFGNLLDMRAQLFPLERLVDLTAAPSGSCVSTLALASSSSASVPLPEVTMITARGGVFGNQWNVALSSGDPATPDQQTTRTFQLCPTAENSAELTLAAGD